MSGQKMDSRELGLVLAQQLLGVEDLHYGLWEPDLALTLQNIAEAQQRYTNMLLQELPAAGNVSVLDIGCGTGHILGQMLDRGYHVDGVIPAPALAEKVRQRLTERNNTRSTVFECKLEDLPETARQQSYDVALFSESYQYIPMEHSFPILQTIVKPGGLVVICDFFKTAAEGDGQRGDRSFSGGHKMSTFYELLPKTTFEMVKDIDITPKMSPNLALVNDILMTKLAPAGASIGRYMRDNYPRTSWLAAKLFGKKFSKAKYKYFSGLRSKEVFERYKIYRLIVLRNKG